MELGQDNLKQQVWVIVGMGLCTSVNAVKDHWSGEVWKMRNLVQKCPLYGVELRS